MEVSEIFCPKADKKEIVFRIKTLTTNIKIFLHLIKQIMLIKKVIFRTEINRLMNMLSIISETLNNVRLVKLDSLLKIILILLTLITIAKIIIQ